MQNKSKDITELQKIVDNATDAVEYKLVVASLIAMIGKLSFDSRYDLRLVLERLIADYNSTMSIDVARRKCKAAITAVTMALQYN